MEGNKFNIMINYLITIIIILEEAGGDEDISAFLTEANGIINESNTLLEAK